MLLYHIASISKIVLGSIILLITYTSINIYQDPAVAIGLGFVGLFIFIRGVSFYIFLGLYSWLRSHITQERILKNSYKLSLLFGIYCMINVLMLLLGIRNTIRGIVLLVGFVALQVFLFQDERE